MGEVQGSRGHDGSGFTRRGFLCTSAVLAGGALAAPACGEPTVEALRVPAGTRPSRVVLAQSHKVLDARRIHEKHLAEIFHGTLLMLAGTDTVAQAWHTLLRPDDIIGIKFNRSGQAALGTTDAMANTLVSSLLEAGWLAERIVCIEAPDGAERRLGTHPATVGFSNKPTDFGSGKDEFARVLDQVTAIINVPFLKTHNIAGMTCALKNLSHGLIKHPARYHRNGCTPYIADILATPSISDKLRLTLVDGLRVVYDRGPEPTSDTINDAGFIMMSKDPVAIDTVGLALLNDVRRVHNLSPFARSPEYLDYLADAHRKGLGHAVWHAIDLIRVAP